MTQENQKPTDQRRDSSVESTDLFGLFCGWEYYPNGGMHDYKGAYPSIDAAIDALPYERDFPDGELEPQFSWWHVANLKTMEIVKEG